MNDTHVLEVIVASAAAISAVAALGALFQARREREGSVLPKLVLEPAFTAGRFVDVCVVNVGLGPALDPSMTLTVAPGEQRWEVSAAVLAPRERLVLAPPDSPFDLEIAELVAQGLTASIKGRCSNAFGSDIVIDHTLDLAKSMSELELTGRRASDDAQASLTRSIEELAAAVSALSSATETEKSEPAQSPTVSSSSSTETAVVNPS